MNRLIADIDWDTRLVGEDINASVKKFYESVDLIIYNNVPLTDYISTRYPSWFNREIRLLISDKKTVHANWKRSNSLRGQAWVKA